MPPLLVARAISKSYVAGHGRCWARVQVLASVSLSMWGGERIVVFGERGAGKTTLLHCLTGLRRPESGTVRWNAVPGAPYRLCGDPSSIAMHPETPVLLELPDSCRAALPWIEALYERRSAPGGWLVFSRRFAPLLEMSDRGYELRGAELQPLIARMPRRVAESARAILRPATSGPSAR